MGNSGLRGAKARRNDEFYTRYEDIEKELYNYWPQLKGKKIYCPCDDSWSKFVEYFKDNIDKIGLERVVATGLEGKKITILPGGVVKVEDIDDGSFLGEDAKRELESCDVVITNPPFSLSRDFMRWIGDNDYLIVFPLTNVFICKETFAKMCGEGKPRVGYNHVSKFDDTDKKMGNVIWLTTLGVRDPEPLVLDKSYSDREYQRFDRMDVLNVDRVKDIPKDYDGLMGVPISFLEKWNPNQFELVGQISKGKERPRVRLFVDTVDGKYKFRRVIIRKK